METEIRQVRFTYSNEKERKKRVFATSSEIDPVDRKGDKMYLDIVVYLDTVFDLFTKEEGETKGEIVDEIAYLITHEALHVAFFPETKDFEVKSGNPALSRALSVFKEEVLVDYLSRWSISGKFPPPEDLIDLKITLIRVLLDYIPIEPEIMDLSDEDERVIDDELKRTKAFIEKLISMEERS